MWTLVNFLLRMNWNNARGVLSCYRNHGLTSIRLDLYEPSKLAFFVLSNCMRRTWIGSIWAVKICLLRTQQLLAHDLELLTILNTAPVHTIRPVVRQHWVIFRAVLGNNTVHFSYLSYYETPTAYIEHQESIFTVNGTEATPLSRLCFAQLVLQLGIRRIIIWTAHIFKS